MKRLYKCRSFLLLCTLHKVKIDKTLVSNARFFCKTLKIQDCAVIKVYCYGLFVHSTIKSLFDQCREHENNMLQEKITLLQDSYPTKAD